LQQVAAEYQSQFGINLIEDIKGDTSGDYRELLVSLVEAKPVYIARTIHNAVAGLGTNEGAIIDCLAHAPTPLIRTVHDVYHRTYNKSIVQDIEEDTSGNFKKILVGLLNEARPEVPNVDLAAAAKDAETIYSKGEGRLGTDDHFFIEFFVTRSFAHIREVDRLYTQQHKHPLKKAISNEFSGDAKQVLKALAQPRALYFAKRIYTAIKGLGTNDSRLIRAFVLNNREQLHDIEQAYNVYATKKKGTNASLIEDIKGDTSGWYEKTLLGLLH